MMPMSAAYIFPEGAGALSELGLVWEDVAKGLIAVSEVIISSYARRGAEELDGIAVLQNL
jgi:hypothetical protein